MPRDVESEWHDDSFATRFWRRVCPFQRMLLAIAVAETVFLLLLLYSLVVGVEPGSGTAFVLKLDFVLIVPSLVAILACYRRCRRSDRF